MSLILSEHQRMTTKTATYYTSSPYKRHIDLKIMFRMKTILSIFA